MKRIDLKLNNITPTEARKTQYQLLLNPAVYRVFLNGYTKKGYIIFEENKLPQEKLLEMLRIFEPIIISERKTTQEELIESSLSWKNTIGTKSI
ncbi:DUF3213 domain-containing protein [Thermococcus sp. MV5]|uniref:DUF3213 domain-containing protein n=1 Tax=Thermococcus sp. MV5 TaxID=1638272 RepID=UPI00143A0F2D|nr:DUF3213 domain-containing protein [Thermococcus sp. MV5]NJE25504.1 DUF3213 domain-containing protein [Thermococcus sp. MV5]